MLFPINYNFFLSNFYLKNWGCKSNLFFSIQTKQHFGFIVSMHKWITYFTRRFSLSWLCVIQRFTSIRCTNSMCSDFSAYKLRTVNGFVRRVDYSHSILQTQNMCINRLQLLSVNSNRSIEKKIRANIFASSKKFCVSCSCHRNHLSMNGIDDESFGRTIE